MSVEKSEGMSNKYAFGLMEVWSKIVFSGDGFNRQGEKQKLECLCNVSLLLIHKEEKQLKLLG